MARAPRRVAVAAAAMLVVAALGFGVVGGVPVPTGDDGGTDDTIPVRVTDDGQPLDGASVEVTALNGSYVGEGTYTAENGTVHLPVPADTVRVRVAVTYENRTETATRVLSGSSGSDDRSDQPATVGERVSSLVHRALPGERTDPPVADATEVGGPPAHAGPEGGDDHHGPPEHAGPDGGEPPHGPPAHAGAAADHADERDDDERAQDDVDETDDDEREDDGTDDDEREDDGTDDDDDGRDDVDEGDDDDDDDE